MAPLVFTGSCSMHLALESETSNAIASMSGVNLLDVVAPQPKSRNTHTPFFFIRRSSKDYTPELTHSLQVAILLFDDVGRYI